MAKFDFSLSHSKLTLLAGSDGCPRCFYLHCKDKLERPRGPFPSLPGGIDDRMKVYFDQYRGSLPPTLKGHLPGVLWGDADKIRKVRHWRSNASPLIPTPHGTVSLIGAFDDILEREDGFLSIIDGKSRGSVPPAGYAEQYGQTQADLYNLQMKMSGMNPHPETFFVYFTPQDFDSEYTLSDCLPVRFDVTVQTVIAHPEDAMDLIMKATEILAGERPASDPRCAHCLWAKSIGDLEPVAAA